MSLQLIMHVFLALGILMLGSAFPERLKLLRENLPEDKEGIRELLWQPLQELMLGFVFTCAAFFFAKRIFAGEKSLLLSFLIAAAVAAMSAAGAYGRFRSAEKLRALQEHAAKALLRLQRISCLATFFLLSGLLVVIARLLGIENF